MTEYSVDELRETATWSVTIACLRKTALALTRSVHDAEDLTQQTIATLLAKRSDRTNHVGYGRKTMVRLWLDHQRSARRRLIRLARLARTTKLGAWDRDRPAINDEIQRMQRAIETLPPQQKAVLVLRLMEELDYTEIAATLGCTVHSVRANLHLGRRRVRQLTGEPL